jgi:hypothetical protein
VEGKENEFGFFKYEDMTEEEVAQTGGFDCLNKELLAWYISEKEELDKKSIEINKLGQGIQIKFNDEPLIKFHNIRHLV